MVVDLERTTAVPYSDSDEFLSDSDADSAGSWWGNGKRIVFGAGSLGLVSLVFVLVACLNPHGEQSSTATTAQVDSKVGLSTIYQQSQTNSIVTQQAAAASSAASSSMQQAMASSTTVSSLIPQENTADSNPCNDDEEMHLGLCYDKCSSLTNNAYNFRQSAWTCCKTAVCDIGLTALFNCCKHNMGFCSGYDIAGMQEGNKICPHEPGACLTDEELFLGICYKKCALLSNGKYPHRVAAASCCEVSDGTCLIPEGVQDGLNGKSNTSSAYDIGGGCDDASRLTHCKPHEPQSQFTA